MDGTSLFFFLDSQSNKLRSQKREAFCDYAEKNDQISQSKLLVGQLSFYQILSRMLAHMISDHLAHITIIKLLQMIMMQILITLQLILILWQISFFNL